MPPRRTRRNADAAVAASDVPTVEEQEADAIGDEAAAAVITTASSSSSSSSQQQRASTRRSTRTTTTSTTNATTTSISNEPAIPANITTRRARAAKAGSTSSSSATVMLPTTTTSSSSSSSLTSSSSSSDHQQQHQYQPTHPLSLIPDSFKTDYWLPPEIKQYGSIAAVLRANYTIMTASGPRIRYPPKDTANADFLRVMFTHMQVPAPPPPTTAIIGALTDEELNKYEADAWRLLKLFTLDDTKAVKVAELEALVVALGVEHPRRCTSKAQRAQRIFLWLEERVLSGKSSSKAAKGGASGAKNDSSNENNKKKKSKSGEGGDGKDQESGSQEQQQRQQQQQLTSKLQDLKRLRSQLEDLGYVMGAGYKWRAELEQDAGSTSRMHRKGILEIAVALAVEEMMKSAPNKNKNNVVEKKGSNPSDIEGKDDVENSERIIDARRSAQEYDNENNNDSNSMIRTILPPLPVIEEPVEPEHNGSENKHSIRETSKTRKNHSKNNNNTVSPSAIVHETSPSVFARPSLTPTAATASLSDSPHPTLSPTHEKNSHYSGAIPGISTTSSSSPQHTSVGLAAQTASSSPTSSSSSPATSPRRQGVWGKLVDAMSSCCCSSAPSTIIEYHDMVAPPPPPLPPSVVAAGAITGTQQQPRQQRSSFSSQAADEVITIKQQHLSPAPALVLPHFAPVVPSSSSATSDHHIVQVQDSPTPHKTNDMHQQHSTSIVAVQTSTSASSEPASSLETTTTSSSGPITTATISIPIELQSLISVENAYISDDELSPSSWYEAIRDHLQTQGLWPRQAYLLSEEAKQVTAIKGELAMILAGPYISERRVVKQKQWLESNPQHAPRNGSTHRLSSSRSSLSSSSSSSSSMLAASFYITNSVHSRQLHPSRDELLKYIKLLLRPNEKVPVYSAIPSDVTCKDDEYIRANDEREFLWSTLARKAQNRNALLTQIVPKPPQEVLDVLLVHDDTSKPLFRAQIIAACQSINLISSSSNTTTTTTTSTSSIELFDKLESYYGLISSFPDIHMGRRHPINFLKLAAAAAAAAAVSMNAASSEYPSSSSPIFRSILSCYVASGIPWYLRRGYLGDEAFPIEFAMEGSEGIHPRHWEYNEDALVAAVEAGYVTEHDIEALFPAIRDPFAHRERIFDRGLWVRDVQFPFTTDKAVRAKCFNELLLHPGTTELIRLFMGTTASSSSSFSTPTSSSKAAAPASTSTSITSTATTSTSTSTLLVVPLVESMYRCDEYGNVVGRCGQNYSMSCMDIDHRFPWSRGGLSELENVRGLHSGANRIVKGNRLFVASSSMQGTGLSPVDFKGLYTASASFLAHHVHHHHDDDATSTSASSAASEGRGSSTEPLPNPSLELDIAIWKHMHYMTMTPITLAKDKKGKAMWTHLLSEHQLSLWKEKTTQQPRNKKNSNNKKQEDENDCEDEESESEEVIVVEDNDKQLDVKTTESSLSSSSSSSLAAAAAGRQLILQPNNVAWKKLIAILTIGTAITYTSNKGFSLPVQAIVNGVYGGVPKGMALPSASTSRYTSSSSSSSSTKIAKATATTTITTTTVAGTGAATSVATTSPAPPKQTAWSHKKKLAEAAQLARPAPEYSGVVGGRGEEEEDDGGGGGGGGASSSRQSSSETPTLADHADTNDVGLEQEQEIPEEALESNSIDDDDEVLEVEEEDGQKEEKGEGEREEE